MHWPTSRHRSLATLGRLRHVPARPCPAELLYFKEGGRVQAPATVKDGEVTIETAYGRFRFRREAFSRIVPGEDPAREWSARAEKAQAGDSRARLDAAWWALVNGLTPEACEMIRAAQQSPNPDPSASRLGRILATLQTPLPDPETSDLRAALGVECEEARSPHFLLLHQQETDRASARLELLERVSTSYYLGLGFHGLELPVPKRRLVAVHLRDRITYVSFLERQNAGAFRSTFGFYHPTFRVVLTYDLQDDPVRPDGEGFADRRFFLNRERDTAYELGTAAHETVHLLVAASGLDGDPRNLPLWFHEGFAAQFEVVRGGRWSGIGRAHDLRLPDWRASTRRPRLSSLLRDQGFERGYDRDLYAASWALVAYLESARPADLFSFLDLIRNPSDPVDLPNERRTASFQKIFGDDISTLESDWVRFVAGLKTPLDECDPSHNPMGDRPGSGSKP